MRHNTVIIGAGPGGLAAARAAKRIGKRVLLIDDNWGPGGQIWRGYSGLEIDGIDKRYSTQISDLDLDCEQLILACGARELFLPFPGWTLPHVVGAGGLQALVKAGLKISGKRVIIAGSGPLLLAVAANLSKAGADVALVAEQASWGSLIGFGMNLWRWPEKIVQAMGLGTSRFRASLWPVAAEPGRVLMSDGQTWQCDYLACGFGLVPNLELAMLAGCRIDNGFVSVDATQETSVKGIFAVGELTGIGGVEKAEAEGEAAGSGTRLKGDHASFVRLLRQHFALRPELKALAKSETIVCRCEDVTLGKITAFSSKREAKLQTRCGMGSCQGRICGPALECLLGWPPDTVRQPVHPVQVRELKKCLPPG
jgi:NADPH-dependent 2,4-dienoyl-CoA reductase/sulfur reductase-like enzyme